MRPGATGLVLAVCALGSCGGGAPQPEAEERSTVISAAEPSGGEGAWLGEDEQGRLLLDRPVAEEALLAYASWPEHRIYIASGARDRVLNALDAHVSVSTGHWRIHLPGDPTEEPLVPGVPEREFEEWGMDVRPAGAPPAVGDFRLIAGSVSEVSLELGCRSLTEGGRVVDGGPWPIRMAAPGGADTLREDFMVVGDARIGDDCEGTYEARPLLTWAVQEGGAP